MNGLLKSLKYFTHMFVDKKPEMQIGPPTDVKHVAHIGMDGPSATKPSWMNEFTSAPKFSADALNGNLEVNPSASGNPNSLPPNGNEKQGRKKKIGSQRSKLTLLKVLLKLPRSPSKIVWQTIRRQNAPVKKYRGPRTRFGTANHLAKTQLKSRKNLGKRNQGDHQADRGHHRQRRHQKLQISYPQSTRLNVKRRWKLKEAIIDYNCVKM
ncbi:hypothetical protein CXB51_022182 [Gossypium anomalum]|uniref:CRIB domain-containing protein n=1 Tax=Gossypium anomalum TaxID=47600 RepID=A0A8J5YJU5_9ROSI|nr:hypothetical protein CXB51_022182 [Gossypium anomalum]